MRNLALAFLVAATAATGGGCMDYFDGNTLIFEFEKLPVLHRLPLPPDPFPTDANPLDYAYDAKLNPTGQKCADDDYAAAHPEGVDNLGVPYQQPYEYHAWATINGGPVRIAKFSTRECTTSNVDKIMKMAITTVSYTRLPEDQFAYPKKPSEWYGIVNSVVSSVPSGGATIRTPVRLEQATEIFVTREPAGVSDDLAPQGALLMRGDVVKDQLVLRATLAKVTGSASGIVTAIPADRVSTW